MNIKELRKSTGMSQSKFAAYFGVPVRSIQEWEQERKSPPNYVSAMMERIWKLEHPEKP
ncbi:MAG: helix-turn-helix domain-containing protein [Clostridiales bacterium]|nr:helix-turn-helix domain-containing protein [Clostridiales bacterium]